MGCTCDDARLLADMPYDQLRYALGLMPGEIPDDARPGHADYRRKTTNFKDKFDRGVGFSGRESGEWSGICRLGSIQIPTCYKHCNYQLDPAEVFRLCGECKYRWDESWPDLMDAHTVDEYVTSIWNAKWITIYCMATGIWNEGHQKKEPKWFVYLIADDRFVKIGKANNPQKRLKELQTGNPIELKICALIPCANESKAYDLEGALHRAYRDYRLSGEWFDIKNKLIWNTFEYPYGPSLYIDEVG